MGQYRRRTDLSASAPSCSSILVVALLLFPAAAAAGSPQAASIPGPNVSANANPGPNVSENRDDGYKDVPPNEDRWSGSELVVGDRVKVMFYSRLGGAADAEGAKMSNLWSLIERQDMTGDYVVQLDGTIFLPFLGKVDALGRSEAGLLEFLEKKAAEAFHDATKVNIRIVEREPVYVTGDVPQPGAFKYSPGMMVMHAAVLAGVRGIGPNGPDVGLRLTVLQESERLRQSQLKIADLLAQRDVLVATRNGSAPSPSEDLKNLVGARDAAERIAAAKRISDLEAGRVSDEQKAFADNLAMLNQERDHLTQGLSEAEKSLKFHVARFGSVSEMHNRGVMTDATFDIARSELDSGQSRWNDILAALSRVEARILEVGQQKSKSLADATIARERKINELQAEIQQAMVVRSTLEPALGIHALNGASRPGLVYRIVRRSGTGVDQLDADRFAAVLPGDIVEVIQPARDGETESAREPMVVGRGH
ncbi:MAG TPA: polysaccharide biosynthesis/export family protein [Roseiarcus sp.]